MKTYWILCIVLISLFFDGCANKPTTPILTTNEVSEISYNSAISGGVITSDGGEPVFGRGVCWSTNDNPIIDDNKTSNENGSGFFTSNMTNLTAGTTYYVRAYATNNVGTGYGNIISFKTIDGIVPVLTTSEVYNISYTTAISGGEITSDGGNPVFKRGICWSLNESPTIVDSITSDGVGTGSFTSEITDLTAGTIYHVRAYAVNSLGIAYGNNVSFKTKDTVPVLTTREVSNITYTTAISGGEIVYDGEDPVFKRGVCWSTSECPTIADNTTSDGSGTGNYTSEITGLTSSTTYYVRAYAKNSLGVVYGNSISFKTNDTVPVLSTRYVSDVTYTTAISGGEIIFDGGDPVLKRGVCWSTSESPTIADNTTSDGAGTGNYTSEIIGLTSGTTYYVRAYATNNVGTGYGNTFYFKTTSTTVPSLSTTVASKISLTQAESGGIIYSNGGEPIIEKGVCWSIVPNPTISGNSTSDGIGNESYTSLITGLAAGNSYFIRAYAVNSVGVGYGNMLLFSTQIDDVDGNMYNTIRIGEKLWMAENLKAIHFNDGREIPNITDSTEWGELTTEAFCEYENSTSNSEIYGNLYNWHAVQTGVLCPNGWHVPTETEWKSLINNFGGLRYAGGKLKETGTSHWHEPNEKATNESGFTALPGGFRLGEMLIGDSDYFANPGVFTSIGGFGYWWSSTALNNSISINNAFYFGLSFHEQSVLDGTANKRFGFSIRCLKD